MKFVTLTVNGRQVNVAFDENSIHVYNAFPIKDELKMRGYRWNPQQKSWFIRPGDVEEEMAVLKNDLHPPDRQTEQMPEAVNDSGAFPTSYTVLELRNHIDRVLRSQLTGQVWVRGVVASEIKHYAWGSYFDLSDEDDRQNLHFSVEVRKQQLTAIEAKLKQLGVADALEKDLPVFFLVQVGLSTKYTVNVRLTLMDILPEYTQSRIRNQRDITLDRLQREGILHNQKQLKLPHLLDNIGVITSEQGTSVQDIMAALRPFEKSYNFYFLDSRMEGARAVDSVVGAVEYLERRSGLNLDAIIVARGGGSEQSLAVFNDYTLCRRICLANIPVLTAIGHEKDLSAAELCSHLTPTPSTPSGVGKFLHDRALALRQQLATAAAALVAYMSRVREGEMAKIRGFARNIPAMARQTMKFRQRRLGDTARRFGQSASYLVRDSEQRVAEKMGQVKRHNRRELDLQFRRLRELAGRLDFIKRRRENRRQRVEMRSMARTLLGLGGKKLLDAERTVAAQTSLAQASDPERVLKKGFTMTLSEDGQVVKSHEVFKKIGKARLKFYDGIAAIVRKEES
jgi:exodeoxyribonuclease VII large subunit